MRLLRGNFQIWQGRISSNGASVRTTVIYRAWHSHGYVHVSSQFSQPRYPLTFGLGILFWCLESPAPHGIAEPTIAALCRTASPKNLCSPPPSSLLHQNRLWSGSAPSRAKLFIPPCTRPFLSPSHFFIASQSGHLFASQPQRRGQGSKGSTHPYPRVLEPARSALQEPTFSFLSPSFPWFQGFSSSPSPELKKS